MPNPVIVHTESAKIKHYLAIADFYVTIGQPAIYEVEPQIDKEYIPDAYTRLGELPVVVEVQRSYISNKKMQNKIDGFVKTYLAGKHDARTLWIVSDQRWQIEVPEGFTVEQKQLREQAS